MRLDSAEPRSPKHSAARSTIAQDIVEQYRKEITLSYRPTGSCSTHTQVEKSRASLCNDARRVASPGGEAYRNRDQLIPGRLGLQVVKLETSLRSHTITFSCRVVKLLFDNF
jgi:hypothetical protein